MLRTSYIALRTQNDDGLRRAVTKFVRDCPLCQLRSVLNRQIKTHRFTTGSYTPMEVLNIDTIGPVSKDSAENCYMLVIIDVSPDLWNCIL